MIFIGKIVTGLGQFSSLEFPEDFVRGSLNIQLDMSKFPKELDEVEGRGVRKLDNLDSLFVFSKDTIKNNKLGNAKLWKAVIQHKDKQYKCWVVRRVGSKAWRHLELMSNVKLRDIMNAKDNDEVIVEIEKYAIINSDTSTGQP